MSTITYRALGKNNEPQWGQGSANFLSDTDAVAQAIRTRLLLFEGEWWESLTDGTPLWQQILGVGGVKKNLQAITLLIRQRILGTPYVIDIVDLVSVYDAGTRALSFSCQVQTQFGAVALTDFPVPPPQGLPQ